MSLRSSDRPISDALALIESVMQRAGQITQDAAAQHMQAFQLQMREKIGVAHMTLDEPYLPTFLKEREVGFLRALEKLFDQVNSAPTPVKNGGVRAYWEFEYKAINFNEPLIAQVEERLHIETVRYERDLKQGLDQIRQQRAGIKKYIWRTAGDERVRPSHAEKDGKVFSWGEGEAPGDAPNCRCVAEPVLDGDATGDFGIESAYPELFIAAFILLAEEAAIGILVRAAGKRAAREAAEEAVEAAKPEAEALPSEKPPLDKPKPETEKPFGERPHRVPEDWKEVPSKRGEGTKYVDPKNQHNDVRIQKGNPNSEYENSKEPYVRWKKDGQWLDKDGNPSTDPEKTHIPLEEFEFDWEIFR